MNSLQTFHASFRQNAIEKAQISQRTLASLLAALLALTFLVAPEIAMAEPWDDVAQSILEQIHFN